jgi:hypothetical protein
MKAWEVVAGLNQDKTFPRLLAITLREPNFFLCKQICSQLSCEEVVALVRQAEEHEKLGMSLGARFILQAKARLSA